jgi:hypothetical protein
MRKFFNEEQLMVLKEIAQDQELVDRVKWWIGKEEGEKFCPMSGSQDMSMPVVCKKLCYRIWPLLVTEFLCPCHKGLPAKEAALIIIEEASK